MPSSKFSLRSLLFVLTGSKQNDDIHRVRIDWKALQKWKGPPRIRTFLWMAVRGKLLTNSQRAHRHLTEDGYCSSCNTCPETNLHALRDCLHARQVRNKFLPHIAYSGFFHLNLADWILLNLKSKSRFWGHLPWSFLFGHICWFIWNKRNQTIFSDEPMSQDPLQYCCNQAAIFLLVQNHHERMRDSPIRSNLSWKPPIGNAIKINVDVALDF